MQELCLRISAQYRYSCITSLSPDILKARRSVDHGSRDDLGKVCVSGKSFLLHLYEISVSGSLESTRARRPWKDLRKTDVSGHWLAFWFTNSSRTLISTPEWLSFTKSVSRTFSINPQISQDLAQRARWHGKYTGQIQARHSTFPYSYR